MDTGGIIVCTAFGLFGLWVVFMLGAIAEQSQWLNAAKRHDIPRCVDGEFYHVVPEDVFAQYERRAASPPVPPPSGTAPPRSWHSVFAPPTDTTPGPS